MRKIPILAVALITAGAFGLGATVSAEPPGVIEHCSMSEGSIGLAAGDFTGLDRLGTPHGVTTNEVTDSMEPAHPAVTLRAVGKPLSEAGQVTGPNFYQDTHSSVSRPDGGPAGRIVYPGAGDRMKFGI